MRVGRGSSGIELNVWNPVYALAPFVLLMVSIPLAIFAVITTSIAISLLAGRAFIVYIQLTVALVGAYIDPNPSKPAVNSRHSPYAVSPGGASPSRERRHHRSENISSTASQETIVPATRAAHLTKNNANQNTYSAVGEVTRDFEGVGGWRSPGDEDEEALWMGMNSRLQLPADTPSRRYARSATGAISPGQRISWSPELTRMSPAQSRARTPVRFAAEDEDDYFPPQFSMTPRRASNASEPDRNHKRRKSGSSSSSSSSGITMTNKEAGE